MRQSHKITSHTIYEINLSFTLYMNLTHKTVSYGNFSLALLKNIPMHFPQTSPIVYQLKQMLNLHVLLTGFGQKLRC